jgi:hypothetical protein
MEKNPFPPFLDETSKYETIKSPKIGTVYCESGLLTQTKIAKN